MTEMPIIRAALHWFFPGQSLHFARPYGSGHIHRTFKVEMAGGDGARRYLLQQFNHRVFTHPEVVAANIGQVHRHLSGKRFGQAVLTPVNGPRGEAYFISDEGSYWRAFEFIDGAFSVERAESPQQAFQAGKAFGAFAAALHELPPILIRETIPGFHDSAARWKAFKEIENADPLRRCAIAKEDIDFLKKHQSIFFQVQTMAFPLRVVHNDAKLGNVLFAQDTGEVLAVTDWDTIMPGSILADFGDLVRSIVNPTEEDDPNLDAVQVQMPFFEALCRGFLAETLHLLSREEKENLVWGAQWIILEQALRFLSDFLAGDVYYSVKYPDHNLTRARNQMQLYRSVTDHRETMLAIVKSFT